MIFIPRISLWLACADCHEGATCRIRGVSSQQAVAVASVGTGPPSWTLPPADVKASAPQSMALALLWASFSPHHSVLRGRRDSPHGQTGKLRPIKASRLSVLTWLRVAEPRIRPWTLSLGLNSCALTAETSEGLPTAVQGPGQGRLSLLSRELRDSSRTGWWHCQW